MTLACRRTLSVIARWLNCGQVHARHVSYPSFEYIHTSGCQPVGEGRWRMGGWEGQGEVVLKQGVHTAAVHLHVLLVMI